MSENKLPSWTAVLAVVAHPDDESFGLGAVLSAFIDAGARATVLCLTRGEASTLHGVPGELATVRAAELRAAAQALGIDDVRLLDYPDGGLADVPLASLAARVGDEASEIAADGLLVFCSDGVTGHPDHMRATAAASAAAQWRGVGALAWTLPAAVAQQLTDEYGADFLGHLDDDVDLVIEVDRTHQREAVARHPSQAVPGSVLWRRLELLGDHEHLRWLVRPPQE